jgi:hypothetical protein
MLALAIPVNIDHRGNTIVETNAGSELRASQWPQDSEFQLVAFRPTSKTCQVVWTDQLAEDIAKALERLDIEAGSRETKPDWYRRLDRYCNGLRSRHRK